MKKTGILIFVLLVTSQINIYSQFVIKDLLKSSWELNYFRDSYTNNIIKYPLPKKVIVTFNDSLPLITLTGVCNNGFGRYYYNVNSDSLRIEINITLMNCPDIEWDNRVNKGLSGAYKCKILSEEMIVYSKAEYHMCFKKHKP